MRIWADRLIGLSASLGALGLLFVMVVILIDVIGRAAGSPLYGAQDMTTMAMVIVVFGAMALCDRLGGHVSVDLLERRFSPGFNRFLDALSAAVGMVIFLMLAWAVWESAKLSIMLNLSTNLINLPKAWFQWILSAFAVLTALGMALRTVELALGQPDIRPKEGEPS